MLGTFAIATRPIAAPETAPSAITGGLMRAQQTLRSTRATAGLRGTRTHVLQGLSHRVGVSRLTGARAASPILPAARRGVTSLRGARLDAQRVDAWRDGMAQLRGARVRTQHGARAAAARALLHARMVRAQQLGRVLAGTNGAIVPIDFVLLRTLVLEPEARVLRVLPDPRLLRDPRDAPLLRLEVAA